MLRIDVKKKKTCLFRKLDEVLFAIVGTSTRLQKGTNGEEGKKDFKDGATGIILVGGFYVAGDDMRARYFKERKFCLDESVGEKGKERLERGG
jgi:hypothetical protein